MSYQQQPMMQTVQPGYAPQPTMMAQPGQANVVVVTQVVQRPPKDWTYGLFSCCGDIGTCCFAMCFPACAYGKNKQALNKSDGCCGDCCIYACVGPFAPCIAAGGRASIRSKYNISGGGCSDLCAHCCCYSCALTQEKREIDAMVGAGMN
ncbi:hypothetical protein HKX48_001455 [Thoreauomyces humboldtii]|nr:hypothetical protein HKX48_001455 [Thoreauomyces humboldtii]